MRILLFTLFAMIAVNTLALAQSIAQPKVRVRVFPTEDRFITFADGERFRHGDEVSHLVSEKLYLTDKYLILSGTNGASFTIQSTSDREAILRELSERLPGQTFTYLQEDNVRALSTTLATMSSSRRGAQMTIKPRVETLLFSTGERSSRIVYGFSPDRMNPFNEGRAGGKDNEFIYQPSSDPVKNKFCSSLDFFAGQMEPDGFGPGKSNFGFDADEGVTFSILGYGFGFRKKTFEVKSELVFDVEVPALGYKKEHRFDLKGGGRDLYIGVQYSGILVGVEVQKRVTLRQSLAQLLPIIVESFEKELPKLSWQTEITSQFEDGWLIPGGSIEGLTEGMQLSSSLGSVYSVVKSFEQVSVVKPDPTNMYQPFVGEPLQFYEKSFSTASTHLITSDFPQKQTSLGSMDLGQPTPVDKVSPLANLCSGKAPGIFERWLMNIAWIYGYVRYKTILDQPFDFSKRISSTGPRIALIASGVSPKEEKLKSHLDTSGFDFLSWENRPSDDLGMGTAAAVLIQQGLKSSFSLVPLRVLGPRGETQSSTIYQAFEYASKRGDIDYVVVPFKPAIESEAFRMGIELCVKAGKKVFVSQGSGVAGAIEAPASREDLKAHGMGGKVRLSKIGRGVIEAFIKNFNETNLKVTKLGNLQGEQK